MFTLKKSKFDKRTKKFPLARVIGGDQDKMYLYLDQTKKLSLSDLKHEFLQELNLSEDDKEILEKSLQQRLEPEGERLDEIYYQILEEFNKKKAKIILRNGGKFNPLPNFNKIEKIYVAGISGAGKSVFSSKYIKEYLRHYKKKGNDFFILSTVDEDIPLDALNPVRIDLENLKVNPLDLEELRDSIVLFDDTATISDVSTRKMTVNLLSHLLQVGRHYDTSVINTTHTILDHNNSKTILIEGTSVVIFPRAGSQVQNRNYLERYCGFSKTEINKILNLPCRWVMIRRTFPQLILHEKGAYLI